MTPRERWPAASFRLVVRRLLVLDRFAEAADAAAQRDDLLFEQRDGLLLLEHDLIQLAELTLEMRVADLQVDEAWVHGGRASLLVAEAARGGHDRGLRIGV